jgi:predicted nucleic acid-binding protein
MIVVDANIIIYLVRETLLTPLARKVYGRDNDWVVPEIWEAEVLNGLLREVCAGYLELKDAITASTNAAAILSGKVHKCDRSAVLHIARGAGLTAYDAYYVVLARSLGVPLVTEDAKVIKNCPDVACSIRTFLGMSDAPMSIREPTPAYGRSGKQPIASWPGSKKHRARPIPAFKAYKGKFPLTNEFINAAKREGRV